MSIAVASGFILLFINTYILLTNNNIDRFKILHGTTFVKKVDLRETMESSGVVAPSDEYFVYYDDQYSEIDEIFVKEGERISIGAQLFRYKDEHLEQTLKQLYNRKERLENQLEKIEDDIDTLQMELYKRDDEELQSSLDMSEFIKSEIRDKEYEKDLIKLNIDDIQDEINLLETKKERLVIKSKVAGVVTKINPLAQKQDDIVMAIHSDQLYEIQGKASEFDIQKMKEGQKVIVRPKAIPHEELIGSIKQITMIPLNKPSVEDKASYYPYMVELNGPSELLQLGYHLDIDIVLKERENVIAVPLHAVIKENKENYIFVLRKGVLEKRKVQLGQQIKGKQEIIKGLEEGERIVRNPSKDLKDQMKVIMPVQHRALTKKGMEDFTKEQIVRLIIKGVME
jgi:HlyD family secretion protein